MKLEIETTSNGYILRDLDAEFPEVTVFEAYEGDRQAFIALVHALAENCGIQHDKFKNDNLRISFDGIGRKFVESDEKPSNINNLTPENNEN